MQDTDSNREIERDFIGDKNGGKKQSNSMGEGSWGQIQEENQTDYTTKILISLSRKSTNKKNPTKMKSFDKTLQMTAFERQVVGINS